MMKLCLNRCEVRKDIRVIKLKVIQYCDLCSVMQKLGSLIKKGRVVFVCLNHKRGKMIRCVRPKRRTQSRRDAKVFGNAANQK